MSLFIRRVTAASLLILSAGVGVSVQAGAAIASSRSETSSPASVTAAQAGAGWLGRQFKGKAFIGTKRKPNPSSTAQAVLALAAAGVGGTTATAAIGWLESNFASYVSQGGVDDPGALATVILAAQALGVDPTSFGGHQPANNLVARLQATQQTTGSDAGLFGSGDPTFNGAFRQGLSLMALANQGIANGVTAAGVTWLKNQQCSDGGWTAYRSATGSGNPCPAPDPDTFSGPDTNSTSLAVEGLVAAGASFPVSPTSFFVSAQNADGGFGYIGASSQSPDPDSTGEVIQALVALGQLGNAAFTRSGGATPVSALASFQFGCSAAAGRRGAFVFPGVKGPNVLATLQAVPGEAQVAFPLTAQTLQPGLPKLKCPAHSTAMARFDHRSRQRTAAAVAAVLCTVIFTMSVPDGLAATTAAPAPVALRHAPECGSVRLASATKMVVPVVVDTGGPTDSAEVACVTVPVGSNGAQVLTARAKELGVPAPRYAESGLLCAIDGFPATGCGVQNGTHYAYWAYYHGGSSWTYASVGPASWKVGAGDVEGWRFQPEGSASPADPPPRAPSAAAILCPASTTTTTMATPPPTTTTTVSVPVSTAPGSSGGHADPGSSPAPVTKGAGNKPSVPATTGPRPTSTTRPGTVPPSSTTAPSGPTPPGDVTVFGRSGSRSIGHLAAAHPTPGSKHAWVWISIALVLIVVLAVAALMRTRLTKTE